MDDALRFQFCIEYGFPLARPGGWQLNVVARRVEFNASDRDVRVLIDRVAKQISLVKEQ